MADTKLSIVDLVTPNQEVEAEANTLKQVLDVHDLEQELPDYEPKTYSPPIELVGDVHLWELKEDLPEDLPDANYVVIDVVYFSTTAVEAFSNGVEAMHLRKDHDKVLELKNSEGLTAGGERDGDGPKEGFDFYNSPTNVKEQEISGEVAMTSHNGANAALKISENAPESANIYIGTTSNAQTIGDLLKDSDKPVHIVCSGTRGSHAAEDHIGAYVIARYVEDQPLDEYELQIVGELLDIVGDYIYEEWPDARQTDIQEHVKAINSCEVVPELVSADEKILRHGPKV